MKTTTNSGDIQLTQDQKQAKTLFEKWWKTDKQVFVLNGLAGTGKTSIARTLAEGRNSVFAAYTGKAASVLRSKGIESVGTLHSLIYIPKTLCAKRLQELEQEYERHPTDELAFRIKQERINLSSPKFCLNLEPEGILDKDLIVIDECSMVDNFIGNDLLSFGKRVLALGDPGQLPPINGTPFFNKADYELTEIIRQKNDIVNLAASIRRTGQVLDSGNNFNVLDKSEMGDLKGYDTVIVWRNETRRAWNLKFKGHDEVLKVGDRLCCLTNSVSYGIMNGTVWDVLEVRGESSVFNLELGPKTVIWAKVSDGFTKKLVPILKDVLTGKVKSEEAGYLRAKETKTQSPDWLLFDYGWCLTCHKAQGSEWDKVAVVVPNNPSREWLYTAVTRAKEQVDLYI